MLQRAISGDNSAIELILLMYMPIINRYSVIDGKFDDDCRQYILMHISLNLRKFVI
ncbi:helix-turn-helix domain-containing protein [Fournierella massiliensis]|uniref:Helix-turn-helix domain-containing protein n=1 Tax=Allofournierella massiliensis TaxID=1650663 RepID=A0ABT7UPU6_9FIRM|nr:helix-turn-helix domain-containing protein [Fournierella massiliensis]MDM8200270.1 helix-turn-helix domain-containing protein [Fournierella massiliensis]